MIASKHFLESSNSSLCKHQKINNIVEFIIGNTTYSYYLNDRIKNGRYGTTVYKGQNENNQQIVAIKNIKKIVDDTEQNVNNTEISIMKQLINEPNIIKFYGDYDNPINKLIVMECATSDLFTKIENTIQEKNKGLNITECIKMLKQVLIGIDILHEKKIVHLDIKPENILVMSDGTYKIADFGLSKMFNDNGIVFLEESCGSPLYAAPELFNNLKKYNAYSLDMWSIGIMLYTARCCIIPKFTKYNIKSLIMFLSNKQDKQDKKFNTILKSIINYKPTKRATAKKILEYLEEDN